jgi:hypothetical protein
MVAQDLQGVGGRLPEGQIRAATSTNRHTNPSTADLGGELMPEIDAPPDGCDLGGLRRLFASLGSRPTMVEMTLTAKAQKDSGE